jgi:hypothetical protein
MKVLTRCLSPGPGIRLRRFVPDSPLEQAGFEPSVPPKGEAVPRRGMWVCAPSSRHQVAGLGSAGELSARQKGGHERLIRPMLRTPAGIQIPTSYLARGQINRV